MAVILIVDDNPDDRRLLELMLDKYGDHRTLSAANAEEAYRLAPQADLILLDVMMPRVDGVEVFKTLRGNPETSSLPIIFMTAYPERFQEDISLQKLGSIDYLAKPLDKDQLINQIDLLLGIKTMRRRFRERGFSQGDQLTLLLAAMEQTGDGFTVTDREGRWLIVNHSMAKMFGYGVDEFMKLAKQGIYEPESVTTIQDEIIPLLKKQSHWEGELAARRKNGEIFPVLVSLAVVKDKSGKFLGIMGITRDITALKKAYSELKTTQEALVQAERLKALGEMVGGIAHEFNNLLANILGNAQLLLKNIKEKGLKKHVLMIERAAISGSKAVKRLQTFSRSRPEGGRLPVDLINLLKEVLNLCRPRWIDTAQKIGREIKVESELKPLPAVRGNPEELQIAFANIIFNAIDALPEGGEITVRGWADSQFAHVQIIDNGIGMNPDILEKIFEPYFTTSRPLKSGLGLSEAYGTIKKHGGDISIKSAVKKGTTVDVTLPVAGGAPERVEDEATGPGAEKPEAGKILIIDDDQSVLEFFDKTLRSAGYLVSSKTSSREGLEAALQGGFNLVITDLRMEDIDGLELARQIKASSAGTKIALITGWEEAFQQSAIKDSGIDAVWEKPFTSRVILEEVSRIII